MKICAGCHGADAKGSSSRHTPDFTDAEWQHSHSDAQLAGAITNGTDGGMPAFGQQLTPEQVDALVHCMIRGFAQPAPAGR